MIDNLKNKIKKILGDERFKLRIYALGEWLSPHYVSKYWYYITLRFFKMVDLLSTLQDF